MPRRSMILVPLLLGAALPAPLGCGERAAPPAALTQSKAAGGLSATISVDRAAITTAQRATLRVEAVVPPGWDLVPIDIAPALPEGLTLVESRPEPPRGGSDQARRVATTMVLEPFLDGTYEVKPFTIVARPRVSIEIAQSAPAAETGPGAAVQPGVTGAADSAKELSLATEPISIKVTSVVPAGESELAKAKGIVDPREPTPWLIIGLGCAALVMGAGVVGWLVVRRRMPVAPAPVLVPAHELALRRLDELLSRGQIERGDFEPFYADASLILRTYIEDRFSLHAPERTTEEFLQESRTSAVLMGDDVRVLERFLGHVDLVKFAAVVPSQREAQSVASTIREFVERTKAPERMVEVGPASGPVDGAPPGDAPARSLTGANPEVAA